MKIGKYEHIIVIKEEIDETARPLFAIYSNGDPEKNPASYAIQMAQVTRKEIYSKPPEQQSLCGFPAIYSILCIGGKTQLTLWPVPDQDYHAMFEFNPPRRRL